MKKKKKTAGKSNFVKQCLHRNIMQLATSKVTSHHFLKVMNGKINTRNNSSSSIVQEIAFCPGWGIAWGMLQIKINMKQWYLS